MKEVKLTAEQQTMMEIARIGFMNACPFFCHYFYSEMKEQPTLDLPTAGTDGRRLAYNPEYLLTLKPPERVFVLAHEVFHAVSRHPSRMKHYGREDSLRGLPWSQELFNIAADLVINAELVEQSIGICNPAWLFDPNLGKSGELPEDVYERLFKKSNQGGRGSAQTKPGTMGDASRLKGGKSDKQAEGNGGRFDELLEPQVDPVSGREDLPSETEFKEAVARAAAAAKAMGKMPAGFQRMVDEILEPQVNWREHIRMLVTGRIGSRSETWDKVNRRRVVLNALRGAGSPVAEVVLPGRRGFGAKTVAVGIDTSGSIGERELSAFFAEVGGIIADVRPKRVLLLWCDAAVHRVDEASSLDELAHIRAQGAPGGGGTSFIPVFEKLAELGERPETLIYLTDMYGSFPDEVPAYPTIWCATTDVDAPFGEVVRIKL
jgi:predicted metal-dependent peptidase